MKSLNEMTALVVGLGQIGGSIGLDLVGRQLVARVIGFDSHKAVTTRAMERRAIHQSVASLRAGLNAADLVILATPIDATQRLLPSVLDVLPKGRLCCDVASTKGEILRIVSHLRPQAGYVGLHPIAGTEGAGIDSATADLFDDRVITFTPSSGTSTADTRIIKRLITGLGGKPLLISAQRHDRLLAQTSHLPYAIAAALVHVTSETGRSDRLLWQLAGGSLRSATRVARSSPELTGNLFLGNRAEVSKAITRMESELSKLRKLINQSDSDALMHYVRQAHKAIKREKK